MKTKWMLVLVLGVVAPLCMAASKPVSVELREARYTEEMKGDLDQAIKLYEKIAFNAQADRRYIAEALFRLGTCYAKKGIRDKAEIQFNLVITQYADQTDYVTRAQKELATLQGKTDGVVAQAVQTISGCAEGDPKVKAALESLKGHDVAAIVTELVKHLDSKIDTVRRAAIYILWRGNFSDIQPAVAKLTDLCKYPEEFTRGMAALALGQNKVASAYDALCTMTAADSSPYARRCGAYALGLLGKPEAKPILEKAAQDPDTLVSDNAKAAMGMLEPGKLAVPAAKATVTPSSPVSSKDLQKLIDSAKPDDTLIIPDGVYTEPVIVSKSVTLQGASRIGCVFEITANRPAILVDTQSKGRVNIENLTIKWQLATSDKNTEFPYAVGFKDSKGRIKNCSFIPLGNTQQSPVAVQTLGFTDLAISTCRFRGFDYTISFGDGTTGILEDSLVMNCGHQGIILYSGTKATVRGNVLTGSGYHAVRNTGGTLTLQDNLIIDNKNRGVYLGNKSSGGVIRNNLIVRNATGINGFASATYLIENNVIADSSYAGIAMEESCHLTIQKNILQGNDQGIAFFARGGSGGNTCKDNTFWKNKKDVENYTLPNDSILQDPQFASPATGDYSLKDGASKTSHHGLSSPELFGALWKRWQNRKAETEPFGESSGPGVASSSLSTISVNDKLEAEKTRAQAWQLWQQQKFAGAEVLFQQAVEKDPTNANGWNGYGWTLFNLGRPEAAKEAFTKCIEIDPKQGAAFNGLGWIAKDQGQIDEAIMNWEQAVKVLPNGTAAMNGLAMTYMEKQDYAKAAKWYQSWLKIEPGNADAKAGLEKAQGQMSK